ncbi:molybdate ABC transporter substrate-binding protein [Ramlibacter tataouinensis]|uniref:Molybdate ABC transporter substrate-binding protein n=1 Tax=Ramlibacter tataouinensis TaxID=94132 RepID=A0A127JZ47_9BURK|nr:molybdate ABC transporter substrate-binding protein [Ramlibacter tataouinensis]
MAFALATSAAAAGEVQVAVAANFAAPMTRIAEDFTAATGHTVKLSAGSTGKFYSQIVSGAPFEVLLAADDETPTRLVKEGHAVASSQFTYAVGRLALWSATPGLVDNKGAVLASGKFKHLAIANPKLAPYGVAAYEALKSLGLEGAVAPKVVLGESIAQTYQFVATGNAELGFVAVSQVTVPGKPATGSWWLVPPHLYTPIRQDAVLLKAGENNPASQALLLYLKRPQVRQLIASFGYS